MPKSDGFGEFRDFSEVLNLLIGARDDRVAEFADDNQ